ncbi:murein L,D-transpeptidase YafK [Rhodoblastus sphagnicola]|uniref:L,D-transpeptidase family protein n=1 Tax=Rhodoblastus sphagnicola TaxID=333368 RepID=UPI00161E6F3A|nr:murein L,D-transpeptidase family protein [Rhodoblastus sphagnicola]MBB4198701.1 murein L,D-transpeptidase YafK [Rhodoblastus sphagnicola]
MSGQGFFRLPGWPAVSHGTAVLLGMGVLSALSGCNTVGGNDRAMQALSSETVALLAAKGVTADSPMLIRAYKKESEFEVWKMRPDGSYVLLKTFPICRWSGQLGPKRQEGDRQSPEGFYSITPAQMNPNSAYYLSFNVGYPNAYDRAHGATGSSVMVHGVCSSAGCFSMTDRQIAEIYALARESFSGGQRAIQMQALPFHLTATNLAKFRLDPNMPFWKELKKGADHFEATHHEVSVGVCGARYVFGVKSANGQPLDPEAPCPTLAATEPEVESLVAQRERADEAQVAALVKQGERPVRLVYKDGAQHPVFANITEHEVSRPEDLTPPVELALDGGAGGKARAAPISVAKKLAQDQSRAQEQARAEPDARAPAQEPVVAVTQDSLSASKDKLASMLSLGGAETATAGQSVKAQAVPEPAAAPARSTLAAATAKLAAAPKPISAKPPHAVKPPETVAKPQPEPRKKLARAEAHAETR